MMFSREDDDKPVDFSGYPWVAYFSDRRQDLHLQDPTWSDSLHVTFTKAPSPWNSLEILLHLWRFFQSFHTESSIRDGDLAHSL